MAGEVPWAREDFRSGKPSLLSCRARAARACADGDDPRRGVVPGGTRTPCSRPRSSAAVASAVRGRARRKAAGLWLAEGRGGRRKAAETASVDSAYKGSCRLALAKRVPKQRGEESGSRCQRGTPGSARALGDTGGRIPRLLGGGSSFSSLLPSEGFPGRPARGILAAPGCRGRPFSVPGKMCPCHRISAMGKNANN